ncbi:hydrolase, alpha/beta fold family, partial [Vibrio harveyi]
SFFIDR